MAVLSPWSPPWANPGNYPAYATDAEVVADVAAHAASSTTHPQRTNYAPTGLTGAVQATRYVGGTTSGAPVAGTFAVGDFVVSQDGGFWVCTVAGTPGTWIDMSSGRGLAYAESNAANAGIGTTYVDLTGLSITFTVGARPVEVVVLLPYVLPSAATTVVAALRDSSDVDKATSAAQVASAIFTSPLVLRERISVAGTYTRKVSMKRFGGSGTITVGTAGSAYFASIGATVR